MMPQSPKGFAVRMAVALAIAVLGAGAAFAACRDDLLASQKGLKDSTADVAEAAGGPDAGRCPAERKHYAALMRFRDVLNHCDKSKDRAQRVAGLTTKIEGFRKQMPAGCKP
jgi:hypothetical protein